jgi:lipid II:glycine glycyltransferase (peptidoglycan interpeptide bridge formation enzyme)
MTLPEGSKWKYLLVKTSDSLYFYVNGVQIAVLQFASSESCKTMWGHETKYFAISSDDRAITKVHFLMKG